MKGRPPGSCCQAGRVARVPQNWPPWRAAHCPQRWHIVQPLMWRRFTLPRRAQHGLPQRHVICTTQHPDIYRALPHKTLQTSY